MSRRRARALWLFVMVAAVTACRQAPSPAAPAPVVVDALPSWQRGPTRAAIEEFVARVTTPDGPDFVPPAERIATFDNDGTLWIEKPLPNEVFFVLARVRELARANPSLARRQPFKAALEGDAAYFHEAGIPAIAELINTTHSGMTQEDFATEVRAFIQTATHPRLKRPFTALTYAPMRELLDYLRGHDFDVWICSGGTADFMRVFSEQLYGVPPDHVIGTQLKRESRREAGRLSIFRLPAIDSLNDKDVKPVNIDRQIGRRPVFVGGNVLSGGDIAMMEYSRGRPGPSFQLLVNHDDASREVAYEEKDGASLAAAKSFGFTVVSMKNDWTTVFR